jgi:hypothetical protein
MHAICANQVTCAAPGCHQPGTVAVGYTPPARKAKHPKTGQILYLEGRTVALEYCERHAATESE